MTESVSIVFTPSGLRGRFAVGTTVLAAAQSLGVDLDSVCGGRGICGRCQFRLSAGKFAKHKISSKSSHISEFNTTEAEYHRRRGLIVDGRLGCQTLLFGDVVIDVPMESQRHRQVVRKRAEAREIEIDPLVTLHYVKVEEPDMHKQASDLRRLLIALEEQWSMEGLTCDPDVIANLQRILRVGEWSVTAAVYDEREIISLFPGLKTRIYGFAIDIGSTTIAMHMTDLGTGNVVAAAGIMNPQIRFGEDLMSRVSYAMMNEDGDLEMTETIRDALNELAQDMMADPEHEIDPMDVVLATIVGNPIMHHLLMGFDPVELGGAPFALAVDDALDMASRDLALFLSPGARAYLLPCIAGHVGADCAAVILSEAPHKRDEISLIVDVGTNAEIVLGNRERLLVASSPTGPAFEGAQISCGQRAAAGAIERVRIDSVTLEPLFRIIGLDAWSDEDGFFEAAKQIGITGICGSGIIEALVEMFMTGILKSDGTIDGTQANRNNRIVADGRTFAYVLQHGEPEIRITQTDIRAIQLAKAALYAGAKLLMDRAGITEVDRIVLTGAFGANIDPVYAMVLGMIPDCDVDKVSAAGNAAGTGARIALLNRGARREIEAVVRDIEKVETAIEPKFQEHFVDAMAIPHATDSYTKLRKVINLPEMVKPEDVENDRQRRRRRRG